MLQVDFLSCVNDLNLYDSCMHSILKLNVPQDVRITTKCVTGAESMTKGYNELMRWSKARIKVYLHQDVEILDKDFIFKLIHIFNSHPEIAMLGMVGGITLPESLVWWECTGGCYGKVQEFRTEEADLNFADFPELVKPVDTIDGLLMATQYDLPWNEKIPGFHFYDTSHSLDFTQAQYQVAVPKQITPWVLHKCGTEFNSDEYLKARDNFREVYRL